MGVGFTCRTLDSRQCTVRQDAKLWHSPIGEFSYVKVPTALWKSMYSQHPGMYLYGLVTAGDFAEKEHTAAESEAMCNDLGKACAGFTCRSRDSHCTVRRNATLHASPT